MTTISIGNPLSVFTDTDGSMLTGGYVYVGTANQNPETSPITVYWDSALTQPAAQPLRTAGGYIVRNGTPATVYSSASDYSLTVRNLKGNPIIYVASAATAGGMLLLSAAITQISTDLADTSNAAKGGALIGLGSALTYPANTVGRAANDFISPRGRLANDGTTNDYTALNAIVQAAPDGSIIYLPDFTGNGYRIDGTITLPTNKNLRIFGAKTLIKTNNSGETPVFLINNASSAATDPRHLIDGFEFLAITTGQGCGVRITDSQEQAVHNCIFRGLQVGVLLLNATIWTEGTTLDGLTFWNCDKAIKISKGVSANASLAGTRFRDINVMSMFGANSSTPVGISIETGASIYRSQFDSVIVFPDKNNSTGFYCDGDLSDISGSLHIENTRAGVTGNVAFKFDTNCSNPVNCRMYSDVRGVIATKASIVGSVQVQGWVIGNQGSAPVMFKKSSVITYLRGIIDDDISTARFYERVNGSGVLQWLASSSAPAEMRDITDPTKFSGLRQTTIGTGTNDVTSTGAAQVITPGGWDCLRFAPGSASSWSTVTGMQDGQMLDIFLFNGNATINHNDVAGGIVLKAGVAIVGAGKTIRTRYVVDRLREF